MKIWIYFLLFLVFSLCPGTAAQAADAPTFIPTPISIKASAVGGLPVGAIVPWPAAVNPPDWNNWLECTGQATSGYPELAAVVGANVPDLRGKFLRGFGGNSTGLGATQPDAGRNITGRFSSHAGEFGISTLGAFHGTGMREHVDSAVGGYGFRIMNFDASRVWGSTHTATEFRPVNMAVRYLIRARP